ncbi:MAG: hypothetical protein WDZ72_12305 [Cyclobacteriaceae bacterium]
METFTALLIFTLSYGFLFLSLFPIKALNKPKDPEYSEKRTLYKQYDLTWPYFFSFLGGYIVASFMVYLIQESI